MKYLRMGTILKSYSFFVYFIPVIQGVQGNVKAEGRMFGLQYGFKMERAAEGYLARLETTNPLSCAKSCASREWCASFFFSTSVRSCQLHADILQYANFTGTLETMLGTKYYATTPTPSTGVPLTTLSSTSETSSTAYESHTAPSDADPIGPSDADPTEPSDANPTAPSDADPTAPTDADPRAPSDADATTSSDADPTTTSDVDPTAPSDTDPIAPSDADATVPSDADRTVPSDVDLIVPSYADLTVPSDTDPRVRSHADLTAPLNADLTAP
ncbi:serine-aspartate repeat-containing protein I-like [Mya arenaria]|uniref:serine-aspartate repeat-containing protein I-like n=1 Tax=Mya arenaria TaxID=6604 RepID=UPI0022E8B78D|nr:serine-aspartate repeat-containing protein I-like [Mya arenaria]